ncbi:sulfatase-like hydrolase/transferase [Acinetobacter rudis]|uniref:sulfatase-like hydrolase/transferase n=1 Tax=Acinetobacter rudis TaxID=632955 RepID=UPI00280CCE71|nr:sulfatase-like hydrolase/transferase [Acinetobacter rudis]MDQ8954183.1 sulfatase-like hydrolase/transferase [Acinetobacter rudis]
MQQCIKYGLPLLVAVGLIIGLGFWEFLFKFSDFLIFLIIVLFSTCFLILIKCSEWRWAKHIGFILSTLICLYIATGTGFLQGRMSIGIIASIYQTNHNEALEFLSVVQYKYIVYALVVLGLSAYFFYKMPRLYNLRFPRYIAIILIVLNVFNLFFVQTARAIIKYKKEEAILYAGQEIKPDWKINKVNYPYDNQIIIIGESVQRNYLSLYGYPEKTTPFLDRMPVTVVDDYISTSANTATSLPRTLAYMDQDRHIQSAMNVVTLANQAGYNTIWISNQGFVGKNDTNISQIAIHAKHQFFLKSGNYMSEDIDDDHMLTILSNQLKKYKGQKNIIFIHMMGSHPDACERLFNSPRLYPKKTEAMNCYLSSINKLDHFIEKAYKQLEKTKRSFNITYFSDHGMTVSDSGIYVDNDHKANYQVPFFILSSDAHTKKHIDKRISAFQYLDIYAGLIGVETPLLKPESQLENLENNTDVTVFDWENYVPYLNLR